MSIHLFFSSGHLFWFFFSLALAAGVTAWTYGRVMPPQPKRMRWVLAGFRFFALALLILVLCGGGVRWVRHRRIKPALTLLLDNSASMNIKDRGRSRRQWLDSLLALPAMKKMEARFSVKRAAFTDTVIFLESPDSLCYQGKATDLARAFHLCRSRDVEDSLSAVLLFSDGMYNVGEDPVRAAAALECPVHTVLLGQKTPRQDAILAKVTANAEAYSGDGFPVDVTVSSLGLAGQSVRVRLYSKNVRVDEKEIVLGGDHQEKSGRLVWTAQEPGFHRLRVAVDSLPGEATASNNWRDLYVQVLKSRLKVTLLAGAPHPDIAYFRQVLDADSSLNGTLWVEKKGGGYYQQPGSVEQALQESDFVILHDFPTRQTPAPEAQRVATLLRSRALPWMLMAGSRLDSRRLNAFHPAWDRVEYTPATGTASGFTLSVQGAASPLFELSPSPSQNMGAWRDLPPLSLSHRLTVDSEWQPMLMYGPYLMAALWRGRPAKGMVFGGTGFYRWGLLLAGRTGEKYAVDRFWKRLFRWLSLKESGRPLILSTDRPAYRSGEMVRLSACWMDETWQPRSGGRVTVSGEEGHEVALKEVNRGEYSGRIRARGHQNMRLIARGWEGDVPVAADTVRVGVTAFNPEYLSVDVDDDVMEAVARKTSGQVVPPDSLSAFVNRLDFEQRHVRIERHVTFLEQPFTLILGMALLVLEWFIRRRRGML